MMKQVCKELINFFKNEEGWDKQELIDEITEAVLTKDLGIKDTNISFYACVSDEGKGETFFIEDFAEKFFDRVIDGVCNVIKTA